MGYKPYYRLCTKDSSVIKYFDPQWRHKKKKIHMVRLVVRPQKSCGLDPNEPDHQHEYNGGYPTLAKAYEACMDQAKSGCTGVWASEKRCYGGGCPFPDESAYWLCLTNDQPHEVLTVTSGGYSYMETIYNLRWLPSNR